MKWQDYQNGLKQIDYHLNIDKTYYILFCASNARRVPEQSFELFIESIKVKRVESCKFFGVYLDEKYHGKAI